MASLSKEQFVKYVNIYERMYREEDQLLSDLNVNFEWTPGEWISEYYHLLTDICNLPENTYYGTELDWYCYDTNFGKDESYRKVYIGDEMYDITDAGALYDLIVKIKENNEQER